MSKKMADSKKLQKEHKEDFVKKPDGNIELTVIIPWSKAKKVQDDIEGELLKNVKVAGFRPGQAPKKIAKEKINPEQVKEEMLRKTVGDAYNEAIKRHNLTPILSPQIHIEVFTEGTDIVFTATTCEEPEIKLGDYKDEIKKLTAKSKIVVPGKEKQKPNIDEMLTHALKKVDIKMPAVLVESETTRLLSQMLDELKRLGMTLDQYLNSKNITGDQLKEEYSKKALQDLELEFFLRKVADEEKITVEKEDIEKALNSIENPKEREEIMKNPYLVASIIRQQKTVNFLTNL
jgi:FKBP-type peptidyl-prolyl cis-trans isomerase (trigger factor)